MIQIRETATYDFRELTKKSWDEKMVAVRKEGQIAAEEHAKEGRHFDVAILGPREILGRSDRPVQLGSVMLPLDWRLAKIREMVDGAACKTLIDSERRKNTQASNDVRARQLVRF